MNDTKDLVKNIYKDYIYSLQYMQVAKVYKNNLKLQELLQKMETDVDFYIAIMQAVAKEVLLGDSTDVTALCIDTDSYKSIYYAMRKVLRKHKVYRKSEAFTEVNKTLYELMCVINADMREKIKGYLQEANQTYVKE